MPYPHTSKKSRSKHLELISYAKSNNIQLECYLYLASILIQSHQPTNKSQESTSRLARAALTDLIPLKKKSGKEFRFFKLSCDGMYREDMFSLLVCIAPASLGTRLVVLCQDIMKQNKSNNSRFKASKRRKRR